jgi:hypothetical protein
MQSGSGGRDLSRDDRRDMRRQVREIRLELRMWRDQLRDSRRQAARFAREHARAEVVLQRDLLRIATSEGILSKQGNDVRSLLKVLVKQRRGVEKVRSENAAMLQKSAVAQAKLEGRIASAVEKATLRKQRLLGILARM